MTRPAVDRYLTFTSHVMGLNLQLNLNTNPRWFQVVAMRTMVQEVTRYICNVNVDADDHKGDGDDLAQKLARAEAIMREMYDDLTAPRGRTCHPCQP